MHANNAFIYDCCNGENVECVNKNLENFEISSPFTFVIKSIQSVDVGALMVSSEHEEA